jgi:4-hydroxy-4-methyl-2-oxoglutarate aldolase
VLVVAPTSHCESGYFGDQLAASLMHHGVTGLIMDAGIRDAPVLAEMGFPVWSKAIPAQGEAREIVANINVPIVCAGALINPGDVIIADEDGVLVVRKQEAACVLKRAREREAGKRVDCGGWRQTI